MRVGRDLAIYAIHAAFWISFGIGSLGQDRTPAEAPAPVAAQARTAPWSRAVLILHMVAFGIMYFGIANAVLPGRVPYGFPGQRIVGTLVIALGSVLMTWSRAVFRSWRFRAKLDEGHQLVTSGPFRLMRHPIYLGLNLLALGSAIWVPTIMVWIGFALMVIGSDLRARSEERLLTLAFGAAYLQYCERTRRFLPGIY